MHPIRSILLASLLMALMASPFVAFAEDDDLKWASSSEQKDYWQGRYRDLRYRAALLKRDAAIEWELYADANRRNYRRGKVRHIHRDRAIELQVELGEVETELSGLGEEARVAGALPGWLREVEFESIDLPEPTTEDVPTAPADLEAEESREGRNPIYLDDEEAGEEDDL